MPSLWPFSNGARRPPILLRYRSSTWFIMMTVAFAVFTIVPVLPFALTQRIHVAEEDVQRWTSILLACYGAAVIIGAPLSGHLSDHLPTRQLPLLLGLLLLATSTTLLFLARSLPFLIIGRLLQGLSAAVIGTVGLALVADTFAVEKMGQAMGYVSLASSVASLGAPVLGGVVYARGGYGGVAGMCAALVGVDALLRVGVLEGRGRGREKEGEEGEEGSELGMNGESGDVRKEIVEEKTGRVMEEEITAGAKGLDAEMDPNQAEVEKTRQDEVDVEKQDHNAIQAHPSTTPMPTPTSSTSPLPTSLPSPNPPPNQPPSQPPSHHQPSPPTAPKTTTLLNPRLPTLLLGILTRSLLLTSFDSTLPLHVSLLFHWTSLGAGLIFLPFIFPLFLAPYVGRVADRKGKGRGRRFLLSPRGITTVGFVGAVPFLVGLRAVDGGGGGKGGDTIGKKILLCALLFGVGCCLVLMLAPLMSVADGFVREVDEGRRVRMRLAAITKLRDLARDSSDRETTTTSPAAVATTGAKTIAQHPKHKDEGVINEADPPPSLPMVTTTTTTKAATLTTVTTIPKSKQPKPRSVRGVVFGLVNCAWAGGALAGPVWGGYVVDRAGWATMTWSLAVLSAGVGVVMLVFLEGGFWDVWKEREMRRKRQGAG
ncbi:hypothetical protein MMC25_004639 [Agyrium rufum]|nr:hypothetical protein [Agyrium rufum]